MKRNFKSLPTEELQELYRENDTSVYDKVDFETMQNWLILRGAKVPRQKSRKPKTQKPKTQKPKTQKPKTQKKPKNAKTSIDVTVKGMHYRNFNVGHIRIGQEGCA